jgi:hypothetical protein
MDGGGEAPQVSSGGPRRHVGGEFDGWFTWAGNDAFEDQSGPYFFVKSRTARSSAPFGPSRST